MPTGPAEFRGDDDGAFPRTSCILQDGFCEFTFTPGHGSGGTIRLRGESQRQCAQDRAGIRRLRRPVAELIEQT